MLVSPYANDLVPGTPLHKVAGRVSQEDYHYFKSLFPLQIGLTDRMIATLFKTVVDELRRVSPEPSTLPGDQTEQLLDDIVSRFNIKPDGNTEQPKLSYGNVF